MFRKFFKGVLLLSLLFLAASLSAAEVGAVRFIQEGGEAFAARNGIYHRLHG